MYQITMTKECILGLKIAISLIDFADKLQWMDGVA